MKCQSQCECGRHRETGRVCDPGCTCGRHTASHGSGWILSAETRAKQSAAKRGVLKSEEHKRNQSASLKLSYANGRQPSPGFRGRTHTAESRAKMSASRLGVPKSPSHRAALIEQLANARPHHPTKIENILVDIVLAEFPSVIREQRFGSYRVDAYLPEPYHLAFEADGAYWHDEERDAVRDEQLLSDFDLPVIRLTERELLKVA